MKVTLILRRETKEDTEPQSFVVDLGAMTWESVKRTVLSVTRGAHSAHYIASREVLQPQRQQWISDVPSIRSKGIRPEISAVTLDMVFGGYCYGTAAVRVKDLVAELQEKAAEAEVAFKATSRSTRKSFAAETGG